jgi:hypothetical protein
MYTEQNTVKSVSSIIEDIKKGRLNLDPDFQRGDVWTETKGSEFIESILRREYIPTFVIWRRDMGRADVLDGRQRLTAIRRFSRGELKVPVAIVGQEKVKKLTYGELPDNLQLTFDEQQLKINEISPDATLLDINNIFANLNKGEKLQMADMRYANYIGNLSQILGSIAKTNDLFKVVDGKPAMLHFVSTKKVVTNIRSLIEDLLIFQSGELGLGTSAKNKLFAKFASAKTSDPIFYDMNGNCGVIAAILSKTKDLNPKCRDTKVIHALYLEVLNAGSKKALGSQFTTAMARFLETFDPLAYNRAGLIAVDGKEGPVNSHGGDNRTIYQLKSRFAYFHNEFARFCKANKEFHAIAV